jgi:hypothetical protein
VSHYSYARSYAASKVLSSQTCWQMLRALRADPPGYAKDKRRETFALALEQSEQLFSAAATVGPSTRPILIFYGLSQAGRALVAAREEHNDRWKLSGHGIGLVAGNATETVAALKIKPSEKPANSTKPERGSFLRVAEVLESSIIPNGASLADLWPLTIPANRFPISQSSENRLVRVVVGQKPKPTSSEKVKVDLYGLPAELFVDHQGSSGPKGVWKKQTDEVCQLLKRYPSLSDLELPVAYGQPIGVDKGASGESSVSLYLPSSVHSKFSTQQEMARFLGHQIAGYECAYPTLDGSGKPLHPLVAWWAVLYGLSMLARYEPALWGRAIDVNQSKEAVPIELLLQAALDHVPELIHRAIVGES